MKEIAEKTIIKIKKALNLKEIEIKNIKNLPPRSYLKTYMDIKKDEFLKHYLILDTYKILSIPVFAIKNKNKEIQIKKRAPSFRRNIGLLEIKKNKEIKGTLYIGNVQENIYYF